MSGLFDDDPPPPPSGPGLFGGDDGLPEAPPPATEQAAAYRVLARKYRPATFDDLIGQDAMVRTLRNGFAQNRIAQAFLLTGVRGIGKTTTARIIARALNCTGPDGTGGPTPDPCGVCPNCRTILEDRHPDVLEMDAASNNGVDDARELRDLARFRPIQGRYKIFYLDECHMLSTAAWNALLKTLEEPPPYLKFVFATTELRKVPVTVLSRCQRFDLRRIPLDLLATHYGRIAQQENIVIEPAALTAIARAADGSVRDGLSLLDQAIALAGEGGITDALVTDMLGLADRSLLFDLFEALMAGRVADALGILDTTYERGAEPGVVIRDLLALTHTLNRLRAIPALRDDRTLPELERTRGAELAGKLSVPVLARAWQMLLKGNGEVETAPDRRAAADMVLIRICHAADMLPPGELIRKIMSEGNGAPAGMGGAAPSGNPDGGARAVANGAPIVMTQAAPRLASFRDVVALVATAREPTLHAHLLHSVRVVRFAPPVIELNPLPDAPRDLAAQLTAFLQKVTNARWTVALSNAPGEATLAEQGQAAENARRHQAADHPLVRAIMAAFPGAVIEAVHDDRIDRYGLLAEPDAPVADEDGNILEFAPPDAEFMDFPED